MAHHIMAVSFSDSETGMLEQNVAGFIHLSTVDPDNQTLTFLTPSPEPLPQPYLLMGSVKWFDTS